MMGHILEFYRVGMEINFNAKMVKKTNTYLDLGNTHYFSFLKQLTWLPCFKVP